MSKSNLQETGYLKLLYTNIALANIGNAGGLLPSSVAGNIYIALYTSDPTDADTGTEANYTGYARVAVPRSIAGFTVSSNTVKNASTITFPISTGVSNIITHFATRTALTGGDLIHYGTLSGSITIDSGDTPKFDALGITITED